MTDEQLDRLVRQADPYRPETVERLDGAEHSLLEEIMNEPVPAPRPRVFRRAAVALAVAAALAGVFTVATVLRDRPLSEPEVPAVAAGGSPGPNMVYAAALLKVAEQNPRLLIDQPGWTAKSVSGFTEQDGSITFVNGPRTLEMNWYPADGYQDRYADRLTVSRPDPATVDGWTGAVFTYSANDFAVLLKPRDGVFAELRAQGDVTRAGFDELLTHVVRVDVRRWLAALPPSVVTPDRAARAAGAVLADIPLPPGFDVATLNGLGTNDPYQFGAKVTGKVGCAWIAEWFRAKQAGDETAQRKAETAMGGSRQWKVLRDMDADGQWPEVFWEIGDQMADGGPRRGYAASIDC